MGDTRGLGVGVGEIGNETGIIGDEMQLVRLAVEKLSINQLIPHRGHGG
jgi:hypothetical protein